MNTKRWIVKLQYNETVRQFTMSIPKDITESLKFNEKGMKVEIEMNGDKDYPLKLKFLKETGV